MFAMLDAYRHSLHPRAARQSLAVALLIGCVVASPRCHAQPTPPPPPPPLASTAQPSPEEQRLLRDSLQADRRGQSASGTVPNAASLPAGTGGPAAYRRQSLATVMNPNISLILDVAAGWFSVEKPLQAGAHDPNKTGFTLQQLELHLDAAVDPYFELQANLVFTEEGVEVEEAYARTLSLPAALQLRAGQFFTRLGRTNATHPHTWNFADQPIVNGKMLGGDGLRGVGAELSWLSPLPWYAEVVVSTQMGTGACCARSFWGDQAQPVRTPTDLMQLARLQQFFPLNQDWSVSWGLSAATGPNGSGVGTAGLATSDDVRTDLWATDLYVRYRPVANRARVALSWQTEAMLRRRHGGDRVLQDWGVTSELVWRYDLRHAAGIRVEHVTGVVDDPLDPDWTGARQRLTAQWTLFPSHFSRLRFQTSVDQPSWRSKPIIAAFVALEVLIGAHGSHEF